MTGSAAISEKPSLYDRPGGVYSIATVVEDLNDRIMVDPGSMPIHGWTRRITKCRRQGSSIW
jgi:hypothetical protein